MFLHKRKGSKDSKLQDWRNWKDVCAILTFISVIF